ncbi:MAG: hypothetical protein U5K75_06100 [Ahrensia sp.]|nr:hypothetical protein [Ahrensia sp.]
MLNLKKKKFGLNALLRRFRANTKGVAAVEFAFIVPILITMSMGVSEVWFRYSASDQFTRYIFQVGDLLARETELETSDITLLHSRASTMMQEVETHQLIEINVASIGFKQSDGTPVTLWTRSVGGNVITFDPTEATGMALSSNAILRVEGRFQYRSPFALILPQLTSATRRAVYFKPRETRALAIDGNVAEQNTNWDDANE